MIAPPVILQSAFLANIRRYLRSKSLWLMLLAAPIAARFMISETEGEGISIAINGQLPVLTSSVLGIWLGIVVSTLVMPIAFIYLRASTTRKQPWQVEEVTAANRVLIALGRFLADSTILLMVLLALGLAGLFLGWLMVTGSWNPAYILGFMLLVAAPTFFVVAALRTLFDAVPLLRGALGDTIFLIIGIVSLGVSSAIVDTPSSFWTSFADMGGAVRPLVDGSPNGAENFAIGTSRLEEGRMALDAFKGIATDGYIASRIAWILTAFGIAAFAGLVYRQHRPKIRKERFKWLEQLSAANLLSKAAPGDAAAGKAHTPMLGLLLTEIRLIASGRLFPLLAICAALAGLAPDFRGIGSPAQLLVLVFALSAHAGRSEAKGLLALTATASLNPWVRRAVFVIAGTLLSVALAIPAAVLGVSINPLVLAAVTGATASLAATIIATASGTAFAARLVTLLGWYIYFAS